MEKIKRYSISLLISFAISIVLLIITSMIFAYTNISDKHLETFVLGIVMLSVLIGSTILLKKLKEKGLLLGAIFGFIFCLIIYLINVLAFSGFFISNTLGIYFAICILSGIIGGVIGVNI